VRRESRTGSTDAATERAVAGARLAAISVVAGGIATATSLIAVAFLATAGAGSSPAGSGAQLVRHTSTSHFATNDAKALQGEAELAAPDQRIGRFHLVDVAPTVASLDDELEQQRALARALGQRLLLWLVIDDCRACTAVERALGSPELQLALPETRLVRINAVHFLVELSRLGAPLDAFPGFVLLGPDGRVADHVSCGEWGADVPENIAPVLKSFVEGTYMERQAPYRGGPHDDETPI